MSLEKFTLNWDKSLVYKTKQFTSRHLCHGFYCSHDNKSQHPGFTPHLYDQCPDLYFFNRLM